MILRSLSPQTLGGGDESRSFDYFRQRTGPQLAGFFPSELWSTLILRAAFHEPAIKHAVLALGALHERFSNEDKSIHNPVWNLGEGGFALSQYNQAIQHLIKPSRGGHQAADVCLIACILFSSFETLRGHIGSALSHVRSGVNIVLEIHANEGSSQNHGAVIVSPNPYVELPTLEVYFNRLDSQMSQMLGTRPMRLRNKPSEKAPGFCRDIPPVFLSLEEARNSMDYQWNTCIQVLRVPDLHETIEDLQHLQPVDEANRQASSITLGKWLAAFQALMQKEGNSFESKGMQAAMVLEINQSFMMTYLEIGSLDVLIDETAWDRFTSRFQHIIALASQVATAIADNARFLKQGPEFCIDMNIVAPLYAVAHRCRDPVIRRKAIALLYASPRQEGIWDGILTARVAERVVSIEEEGLIVTCAADVPDWARLSDVDPKFDLHERRGTVSYNRQRSRFDEVRETVTETIEW